MIARILSPLLASALAVAPSAQERRPVVAALPASTLACVQFGGLAACRAAAEDLGVVQLGGRALEGLDAEMREELLGELRREIPRMHGELRRLGIEPATVRALLQRPIAVGLGRPTFFAGALVPSVAVVLDVAGHEAHARKLTGVLERVVGQAGPEIERSRIGFAGVEAVALQARGHSGAVVHALTDGYLILTNSKGYMDECAAALAGKAPTFADNKGYRAARGKLEGSPLFSAYLDLAPVARVLEPFLPYEAEQLLAALGVADLTGGFIGGTVREGRCVELAHLGIRGPSTGLLRSLLGRPASFKAVPMCPPDTLFYGTVSLDPPAAVKAGERLIAALPPEAQHELHREFAREISRELRHSGMTVDDLHGLLALFGPEITVAVATPAGAWPPPDMVAFVEVSDVQRAQQLLSEALGQAGIRLRETSYEGTTVQRLRMPRGVTIPFQPAFAFRGRQLIVASSTQALRGVLERVAGKAAGLDGAADVTHKLAAAKGASMFGMLRLRSAMAPLWRMAEPLAEMGLAQVGDIDPDILPTVEELEKAVHDGAMAVRMDQDGLLVRGLNPVGAGAMLAVVGMLLDEALGEGMAEPNQRSQRKIY